MKKPEPIQIAKLAGILAGTFDHCSRAGEELTDVLGRLKLATGADFARLLGVEEIEELDTEAERIARLLEEVVQLRDQVAAINAAFRGRTKEPPRNLPMPK